MFFCASQKALSLPNGGRRGYDSSARGAFLGDAQGAPGWICFPNFLLPKGSSTPIPRYLVLIRVIVFIVQVLGKYMLITRTPRASCQQRT